VTRTENGADIDIATLKVTYLPVYPPVYLPTYLPTNLPTHLPTYLPSVHYLPLMILLLLQLQ
jgi:hypothetical protein